MSATTRGLLVDDELVSLRSGQLDGLLETLAQAREANADSVRDDIGALRLIPGTIRLLPTEGELAALRVALAAVVGSPIETRDPVTGPTVGTVRATGSGLPARPEPRT